MNTQIETARWSWTRSPELMFRLQRAQNHPANLKQDIMTCAGFLDSEEELRAHVERYEAEAA